MSARFLSYGVMAAVAVAALAIGVLDDRGPLTTEERVQAIASTIRCPQCRSQSSDDSEASTAQAVRREIEGQVRAGRTDDEIRAFFASRYGPEILLRPPASGVGSLVWVIPVVAVAVAAGGLALAFRRWRAWDP